ncbi:hypothetical protein BJ973_004220 [Actinoplanes tereljensis]|nr:thrombospondin type 3 repeat-containing protein [Actinoplanes tereljensis]
MTLSRAALAALTCGGLLLSTVLAAPARADDGRRYELSDLRVCDLSACYLALAVVDSDGDGTADADEIALGTDPLDASSRPPLKLVLDATLDGKLPTYELGFGTWGVFPEEFVKGLEKKWYAGGGSGLPSEVFGIPTRKDTFALAGIDAGLLKDAGIDLPWINGLSFGLADLTGSGKDMKIDLGRFNPSWYGAYENPTALWESDHGGVVDSDSDETRTANKYVDGTYSITKPDSAGCEDTCISRTTTEYYDPELNTIGSSTDETYIGLDMKKHHVQTLRDKDGTILKQVELQEHDGASRNDVTDTRATGKSKEHTDTTSGKDGQDTSSTTRQKCDANGENCTDGMTTGDDYTGPALPGTAWLSHKEAAAAMAKLLTAKGTTVTPVQFAPSVIGVLTDDDVNDLLRRRDLISLFSGDDLSANVGAIVIGGGWNEADPETRPDLPNPLDGATGSGACTSDGVKC